MTTEKECYNQYMYQRDETFVRNKRKHSSTAVPNTPEKNQPKLMVVLEASKDDRQNTAPERPTQKQVKTVGSLSIDDEWDDDDGIMTSCLEKFHVRVSFSVGKMKS